LNLPKSKKPLFKEDLPVSVAVKVGVNMFIKIRQRKRDK
jgi:hypothetical protein